MWCKKSKRRSCQWADSRLAVITRVVVIVVRPIFWRKQLVSQDRTVSILKSKGGEEFDLLCLFQRTNNKQWSSDLYLVFLIVLRFWPYGMRADMCIWYQHLKPLHHLMLPQKPHLSHTFYMNVSCDWYNNYLVFPHTKLNKYSLKIITIKTN